MITVIFIGIMCTLYFQLLDIFSFLYNFNSLSALSIIEAYNNSKYIEFLRIILFNFFHLNLNHLLINMIAFINFGIPLEDFFNNFNKYLYLKTLFLLSLYSGIFNFLLHCIVYYITKNEYYLIVNVSGFSGVLFALQYLFDYIHFNSKEFALKNILIKLFYISLITKGTSFIGHLSGIFSGILVSNLIGL